MRKAIKDFADEFTSFVKAIDLGLDGHEARIKALEKDNETRVSYISVQPNMSKFQFTQADLDAAVKAEREKIKKRVRGLPYRDDFPKAWLRRGEVWKAIEPTDDS